MSKKKKSKSNKQTASGNTRYISSDNCDALLGRYANMLNRTVAEMLNLAIQVFLNGDTGIAFPIKDNGTASLKKAFVTTNSLPYKTKIKDKEKEWVLGQFIRDLAGVAEFSKHASDLFSLNGYDIKISKQWIGVTQVLSIVAVRQPKDGRDVTPKLFYVNDAPFLGPKTEYSVPLLALMKNFKLEQHLYVCASKDFNVDDSTTHRFGSIYRQSDFYAAEFVSSKGFHKWLFDRAEANADSISTTVHFVNQSHNSALQWHEDFVDNAGEYSLHITPGGMKGRLFLHDLGLLRGEIIAHDNASPETEFLDAVERFSFMVEPSPNANNALKDDWKQSWFVDRPPRTHLTVQQAANIKLLDSYGMAPGEIQSWVGALTIHQVRRVLSNASFRNVDAAHHTALCSNVFRMRSAS